MGITGLIPFLEKASRRVNVDEFSGCTVAIDSYCWLHKGAFACAERLVRGEETDVHIKYCLKYVTMLLSKNIKPIMVFDGRHLPAKALTEAKRRESRNTSKKRAAELLSLGQTEEARSYMRRSVDITHAMALALMRELRARNVDCVVAPYEADSQLAFLNTRNLAHLVITEDSDLLLFGCTKVLFKMDLEGHGTLIESAKLPLAMRCPVERYSLERFRWMCVMSGCDYLPSLPGIGLAKARQFLTASLDNDIANALKKLPSFFNKANLTVTDEYRENFLKAEATFKHQYVYDTIQRQMLRLTEPDDDDTEKALCTNAGELLPPDVAFQLALGNLDPFTMKPVDDWDPDRRSDQRSTIKTDGWKDKGVAPHPSIWNPDYKQYLTDDRPWQKKPRPKAELIIAPPKTRAVKKVVNLVSRYVAETQDESLTIESLSNMYCVEPAMKKQKMESYTQDSQQEIDSHDRGMLGDNLETELTQKIKEKSPTQKIKEKSPILENKERSFLKCVKNGNIAALKRLSRFPRTVLDDNVVESKFFSQPSKEETITVEESPKKNKLEIDSQCTEIPDSQQIETKYSLKSEHRLRNPFKITPDRSNHTAKTEINTDCTEITDLQKFAFTSKKHNEQYKNPLKVTPKEQSTETDIDSQCIEIPDSQEALSSSQKENSPRNSPVKCPRSSESPILKPSPRSKNPFRARPLVELTSSVDLTLSDVSVVENTYPLERLVTPVDSQTSFGSVTQPEEPAWLNNQTYKPKPISSSQPQPLKNGLKKSTCKVPGLKRTASLPSNQPTLLSKFGFQKRPVMKK